MKKMQNKTLLLFALLSGGALRAENLKVYRDGRKNTEESQKKGQERVDRLRDLMGTKALTFNPLQSQPALFLEATSERHHRLSRGLFLKMILDRAMKAIKDDSKWELPTKGTEEDKRKRRLAICKEVIGDDMSSIVDYFAAIAVSANEEVKVENAAAATTPAPADPDNKGAARLAAIASYIAANDPGQKDSAGQEIKNSKITDILGAMTGAKMQDGYVSDFLFDNLEETGVTISMLATFRAGEDSHYLQVFDCIGDFVHKSFDLEQGRVKASEGKEEAKAALLEAKNNLQILTPVKAFIDESYKESVAIHDYVSQLSRAQQNLLLDLFLQLNNTDIPAASEIEGLKEYWVKLTKEEAPNSLIDFQFYSNRHEQLSRLEEKLFNEKEIERIDAIKKQPKPAGEK